MRNIITKYFPKTAALLTPEQEQEIIKKYYSNADPSHGYDYHVAKVREKALELADKLKLTQEQKDILDTAALLHDITRSTDKDDTHHVTGAVEAAKLLKTYNIDRAKIEAIKRIIKYHRASVKSPKNLDILTKILRDADRIADDNIFRRSYLYHKTKTIKEKVPIEEQVALANALAHIQHKYHPITGYGVKTLHFPESKETLAHFYNEVMKAYEEGGYDKLLELANRPKL